MKEFQKLLKQNDYQGAASRLLFLVFDDARNRAQNVPSHRDGLLVRMLYEVARRTHVPATAIARHGTTHGETLYLIYAPTADDLAFNIVVQSEAGADIMDRLRTYGGAMANFIAAALIADTPEPDARYRLKCQRAAPASIDAQQAAENGGCARAKG